ncbi:MAG: SCO family protein [Saccharospirillaceae bacterium]|nr:SCO family protein [Saccharospirillaceae bacterium]
MKKIIPLITLLLGCVFILSVYLLYIKKQASQQPDFLNTHLFSVAQDVQPFELKDKNENVVNNVDLQNNWTIINFGYTSCPDICPTNLADASSMMRILNEDMQINSGVQSWFITLDPVRDSTQVIAGYTDAFHPDLIGLRAPHKNISALALAFGFSYQIQAPLDASATDIYWVAHSDMMVLINPQGQYAGYLSPPYDSQNMAKLLKKLIEDES